jgi:hypothetical protein
LAGPHQAAPRKPKRRPDVISTVAAPDRGVSVINLVMPASGFYPCTGMASQTPSPLFLRFKVMFIHSLQMEWLVYGYVEGIGCLPDTIPC